MIFFFNDTATTEIYTLSLHDALPISAVDGRPRRGSAITFLTGPDRDVWADLERKLRVNIPIEPPPDVEEFLPPRRRSEEHTSELQSRQYLVCRLLLEKKKNPATNSTR